MFKRIYKESDENEKINDEKKEKANEENQYCINC